jgi:predicted SAM-dependent methyltransferase
MGLLSWIIDKQKSRNLIGAIQRRSRAQFKKFNDAEYLNVGCGLKTQTGFVNLDYEWTPAINICWDITRGIPFPSKQFSGIFSEHCLEHFTRRQAVFILREFFHLLKPGGTARLIVPDVELYINCYVRDRNGEDVILPYGTGPVTTTDYTPLMALNRVFRDHGHAYAYDCRDLSAILAATGFIQIERAAYKQGRDPRLLIDSEDRFPESLYMEASKPK